MRLFRLVSRDLAPVCDLAVSMAMLLIASLIFKTNKNKSVTKYLVNMLLFPPTNFRRGKTQASAPLRFMERSYTDAHRDAAHWKRTALTRSGSDRWAHICSKDSAGRMTAI
jgi:hypothetical protein